MEKLFITQKDGNKAEVTNLEEALIQTYNALDFHEACKKQQANESVMYFIEAHESREHVRDQLEELRHDKLYKELTADGWVQTDGDCNQYCKELKKDKLYAFREDREINPETEETEVYESEINLLDYSREKIMKDCDTFGYTEEQVNEWISKGENSALIAECIFELEV